MMESVNKKVIDRKPVKKYVVLSEMGKKPNTVILSTVLSKWVLFEQKEFWYPTNLKKLGHDIEEVLRNNTVPETDPYKWKKYKWHSIYYETNRYDSAADQVTALEKDISEVFEVSESSIIDSSPPNILRSKVSKKGRTLGSVPQKDFSDRYDKATAQVTALEKNISEVFESSVIHSSTPKSLRSEVSKNAPTVGSVPQNAPISESQYAELKNGIDQILAEMKLLRKELDDIKRRQSNAVVQVRQPTTSSPRKTFIKFSPWRRDMELPVSTVEEMEKLNKKIEDADYFAKLGELFKYCSSSALNVPKKLDAIMDQLFDPEISRFYNCNGLYQKYNFTETRIYKEIKGFLERKIDSTVTENIREIEKSFVKWLKKKSDGLRYAAAVKSGKRNTSIKSLNDEFNASSKSTSDLPTGESSALQHKANKSDFLPIEFPSNHSAETLANELSSDEPFSDNDDMYDKNDGDEIYEKTDDDVGMGLRIAGAFANEQFLDKSTD
ncbi:uncharacterized protein LOC135842292 isoform X4 [Planococcus citri]